MLPVWAIDRSLWALIESNVASLEPVILHPVPEKITLFPESVPRVVPILSVWLTVRLAATR